MRQIIGKPFFNRQIKKIWILIVILILSIITVVSISRIVSIKRCELLVKTEYANDNISYMSSSMILSTELNHIKVRRIRDGDVVLSIDNGDYVFGAVYRPEGDYILSASASAIKFWNPRTGALIRTIYTHEPDITAFAASKDSSLVAIGDKNGHVSIWNVITGHLEKQIAAHSGPINNILFDPAGLYLATSSKYEGIAIWSIGTFDLKARLTDLAVDVEHMAISPNGEALVSVHTSNSSQVILWDARQWQMHKVLNGHYGLVYRAAFNPSGSLLATAGGSSGSLFARPSESRIRLWRIPDGTMIESIDFTGSETTGLAFSPDGKEMVLSTYDGVINRCDVAEVSNY